MQVSFYFHKMTDFFPIHKYLMHLYTFFKIRNLHCKQRYLQR